MSNGRSRLLNITLVCSLAINLLLVGGIIGRIAFGPPHHRPMPNHLGWMVRTLDKDTRKALRPDLEAHARQVAPLRREMRAARQDFENLLTQPQLDRQRLENALSRLRKASDAYQQSMHEEMVVILEKMTPEERHRFVRFLNRRPDMRREPPPQPQEEPPPAP